MMLVLWGFCSYSFVNVCNVIPEAVTNPASYKFGDKINFSFNYVTDITAGIRIYIKGMTGGLVTQDQSFAASPLYLSNGIGSTYFKVNGSANTVVDEVCILVYDATGYNVLQYFFLKYTFYISNNAVKVSFPTTTGSYMLNERFKFTFDYDMNDANSKVYFRPFTDGALSPSYAGHGSGLYSGTGSDSAYFTITSGNDITVDSVRVQILKSDNSLLLEFFIPVYMKFSTAAIQVTPTTPAGRYDFNAHVNFDFKYTTTESGGIRIFILPYTDNIPSPNYAVSGSVLYAAGTGNGTTYYTVTAGNKPVDQTYIKITNADQSQTLLTWFFPVDYFFGDFDIYSMSFCPQSAARLPINMPVNEMLILNNKTANTVHAFLRPFTNGSLTPSYSATGSAGYPSGIDNYTGNFTITSGDVVVDNIRIQILDATMANTLMETFIPVHFRFFTPAGVNEITNGMNCSICPNPADGQAFLKINSVKDMHVIIRINDAMGKQVLNTMYRNVNGFDDFEEAIDISALKSGIYFVTIQTGNSATTEILMVK